MRLIDNFKDLFFDMNSTFMFGEDKFHYGEDFHTTYLSVGGHCLSPSDVTRFIRSCYDGMSRDYADPTCYDNFPSLTEGFRHYAHPPEEELPFLERVFTIHELGSIPESSAALLRRLSRTHRLALEANIWAPKQAWLEEFERAGINGIFHHAGFSSDSRSIKPSPRLYQEALHGAGVQPQEALFIGDSLRYDMEGAKKVGMTTLWVTSQLASHPCVDHVIQVIQELETYVAQPRCSRCGHAPAARLSGFKR